jgi:spermidine synthase
MLRPVPSGSKDHTTQTGTIMDETTQLRETQSGETATARKVRSRFFVFFLISGFCSVLYEVIWLRLAMAQFGVTITMTSTVISVFMAGLGVGSWAAGKLAKRLEQGSSFPRLRAYALTELLIGIGSLVVPYELLGGRRLLEAMGATSSFGYYVAAGLWLAVALLPWCTCMGATYPVAMWAMREHENEDRGRSFSYLYVANVVGALGGAVLPLFLIEALGFRGTLRVGGILNLGLAIWAFILSKQTRSREARSVGVEAQPATESPGSERARLYLVLLFATGLTSMGMEVVWIRMFTPYLGTEVYAFATILGIYLASTSIGSFWYRDKNDKAGELSTVLWAVLGLAGLLPLVAADPHITRAHHLLRTAVGISPFTLLLGFLTPMLVDRISGGDPDKAGSAYAVNVVGCIVGPVLAGFVLLPSIGERWSLGILAAFWFFAGGWFAFQSSKAKGSGRPTRQYVFAGSVFASLVLLATTHTYESRFRRKIVLRDNTATVIATGEGRGKHLLINGVGITALTPITKVMAHLPLAFLERPPERALDICFGMGTTYRSLLSWGIRADAVELVPSVPAVFPYFHADAPQLLQSPQGHIIVDDGRRYLERTQESYDVITIDPPPPVEAAGSSLLYSKEFYAAAKRRLRPGGIVAQWLPEGDPAVLAAVAKAIRESFPQVRVFVSIEGWGFHLLASESPISKRSALDLAQRLPVNAQTDLTEWGPLSTAEAQLNGVLKREIRVEDLIRKSPSTPAMVDDYPINEYYLLRRAAR